MDNMGTSEPATGRNRARGRSRSRSRKVVAGLALGAIAFGGGIIGGAGFGNTIAVADDAAEAIEERTGWVADALAGLVADDVITQDQSNAVVDALEEARPDRSEMFERKLDKKWDAWRERTERFGADGSDGADESDRTDRFEARPRGNHRFGLGGGFAMGGAGVMEGLDALTDTLGVTRAELIESVMSGDSIADIAEANGVDVQDVIDALAAQVDERIDAAVDAGKLDAEQADEMRTRAEEAIEAAVNGSIADLGKHRGDKRGFGHGFGFGGSDHDSEDGGA